MTDKKTDAVGPSLLPKEKAKTEAEQRAHYIGVFTKLLFLQGPAIAWVLYFLTKYSSSETSQNMLQTKFQFLHDHQLYYPYWAMYSIMLVRCAMMTNSNGARGPTCLNRPDQHVYQVVGTNDLVLMANHGDFGRFNRAQRAIFNLEESLALMVANTLLVSVILGPLVCFLLLPLYAYGRIQFAHDYKEDPSSRGGAFLFCMIAEHGMGALVALIAIKATAGEKIPF